MVQIILKAKNNLQMAFDGVALKSLVHEVIHIRRHLQMIPLLNRQIRSQYKVFKGVQVVLHRVGGVIVSLKKPSVINAHIGNGNAFHLFQ